MPGSGIRYLDLEAEPDMATATASAAFDLGPGQPCKHLHEIYGVGLREG